MKRLLGSVVLAIFVALAGLPIATAAMPVPAMACCRAHGAHHCADTADNGGEHALSAVCPHYAGAHFYVSGAAAVERRSIRIELPSSPFLQEVIAFAVTSPSFAPTGRAPPTRSA